MSDNTQLVVPSTGTVNQDVVRTIDRSADSVPIAAKTQVVQLDVGGETNESLVTAGNPMPVSGTFWQATQPVSGTITANQGTANTLANAWPHELTDGTNGPVAVKAASTAAAAADKALVVAVSPNNSVAVTGAFFQNTQPVSLASLPALAAGTNAVGQVNVSPVSGQGWPSTYSGSIAATVTAVKTSAGTLGAYYIDNPNASMAYVQIFDAAVASVTLGTTAPKWSIGIPASGAANLEFVNGLKFSTAITIAVTTTRAGSTGPGSTVDINIAYD
ncbi:MAG TPA: hypothetical protein VGU20_31105 [Stellaceae bacterium]|nr:hypothetical protein [Terriglobia bacterium]HEV2551800.1 hypothetical protein [Stellaceae bacterium]